MFRSKEYWELTRRAAISGSPEGKSIEFGTIVQKNELKEMVDRYAGVISHWIRMEMLDGKCSYEEACVNLIQLCERNHADGLTAMIGMNEIQRQIEEQYPEDDE